MKNLQISYFRVLSMLMVVFYHCLCCYGIWPDSPITVPFYVGLCKFMNSIDMPVFFMISAYLYSDKLFSTNSYNNSKLFIKKKVKRLLIPYLFWGIVINLLFIHNYNFSSLLTGISHLWFLLTLMMIFLIMHLTRRSWINLSKRSFYIFFFLFLIISPFRVYIPINILTIRQTLQYIPFFIVGIILASNKSSLYSLFSLHKKKHLTSILVFSLICLFLLCFYTSDFSYMNKLNYIIVPLLSSIIISTFWVLATSLNFSENSILKSLDKNSMGIYIIHHILIVAFVNNDSLSGYITSHYIVTPFVLFFIALSISWIMSSLIIKETVAVI